MTPTVAGAEPASPDSPPLVPATALVAARAADSKSGADTVVFCLDEQAGIAGAFVITSGQSVRQVRSIVDEVERKVKGSGGGAPLQVEGLDDGRWVLLDYGDVLVHVFLDEARAFYDLEHLWSDAPRVAWSEVGVAAARH